MVVCMLLSRSVMPDLCDPTDYSLPGSSLHGILQARILEKVAISSSRGFFWLWDWTGISCIAGGFFTTGPQGKPPKEMVQVSRSVVSDSLRPHGLQHARPPHPSQSPGACSNSCPLTPSIDAIQPFHPLSSPSLPTFNLSQYQGLFQWVSSSHQVAKVLKFQLQHQSFQWIFRTDFL